jgi:glycosyltransferase involved in cell wall biosynthesis
MPEIETGTRNPDGALSKTRICFFSSVASFDTGMPICTHALASRFARDSRYEVHAVVPSPGELADRLASAGVSVSILPFARVRSPRRGAAFFGFLFGLPLALARAYRFMKNKRFALVHFSDIIDTPFYPCAALSGARVVAHARREVETGAGKAAFRLWTALFTRAVVCISKAVLRASGVPPARAAVVYDPGPDPAVFDPVPPRPRPRALASGKRAVLAIGKFHRVKGHEYFIRMAAACERRAPGRMQYVIVGGGEPGHGPYFDAVMNLINEHGLFNAVTITGGMPHEEIPALLSHALALVHLPHYQEGLGGVILEAMSMELPVVAFDSGGIGECFVNGEHGFLIRQYDAEAAADKVLLLAADEALRKKLGAAARAHVLKTFGLERHFEGIEKVYRNVLPRM